ncbi:MAG: Rieske 2Fe-2S domain-containing protein [Chloroflexi bacterium]|nr:Rieske 2Fe-2S domain-containing protein [Chloroflexota bacterium]
MPETIGARLVDGAKGKGLDRLGRLFAAFVGAVYRVPGTRPLKNALHGTWLLRHPLHPAATDVVVGGLTVVAALDVLSLAQRDPTLWRATDIALLVSLLFAAVAGLSGYTDWNETSGNERRLGVFHGVLMTLITLGYVASYWMRVGGGPREPAVWLALVLWVALALVAHLGGELVFGFGTGVNRHAWTLLPQKWQRTEVAEASLEDRRPVRVKLKNGVSVMVVKLDGVVSAIGETCSHASGPLADGELVGPERRDIKCPWHGSVFSLRTGAALRGPATMGQPRCELRTAADGTLELRSLSPGR